MEHIFLERAEDIGFEEELVHLDDDVAEWGEVAAEVADELRQIMAFRLLLGRI